ncbi:hypothetical protein H4W31_006978 [Plantactinospora soyae]|uniref:Uncharacterized protein n=1 Tax=Plantactinospora soyae TaxID=1544732 RepID=A0A927R0A2_9ACTN|nr:hypothetical protein [Plantactinospora soyae]
MLTHIDLVAGPPADRRRSVIVPGLIAVAAVMLAGGLLRDRVPPLDAWILAHLSAPADGTLAGLATVVSGAGTLAALVTLLIAFGQAASRSSTSRSSMSSEDSRRTRVVVRPSRTLNSGGRPTRW